MHVEAWLTHFTYLGTGFLLVLGSVGVPIPEELVLTSAGLLASHGTMSPWGAFFAGWAGVIVGDTILYGVGARFGPRVLERRFFRRLYTPRIASWIERRFAKQGAFAIFVARFIAPIRAPTFLVAGVARMAYWKFLLADLAGSLVTVGGTIYLANRFGDALPTLVEGMRHKRLALALAVLALALAIAVYAIARRRRLDREGVAKAAAERLEHDFERPSPAPAASDKEMPWH